MAEPPSVGYGESKIIIDFLEEENLAFFGCGVDAVEDGCRRSRVVVVESYPRSEAKLLSSPRALLGSSRC
jgi:hypothetical protein